MNKLKISFLSCFLFATICYGQTIESLMDEIDQSNLLTTVNEFSGEISTTVDGSTVTIINRQQANNDLAANYIVERLSAIDNLTITDQEFNTNGRNIIATQLGKAANPEIYIVCAHYDSVADYCADDNTTGTAAVLEIARILSKQCFDNTIIYALWDEEETGLQGSNFYASLANTNNDNIQGVINLDMMGYDGDAPGTAGDNQFDIDYRAFYEGSEDIKDDIITVLNTYSFDLSVVEVPEGTFGSDHASFWSNGFPAVLLGESWETDDQTPFYHSQLDRANTLDLPYFTEMTKLVLAYMSTKGNLISLDNTVSTNTTSITANQNSASYQWYNCNTDSAISGETSQSFVPENSGMYKVEITSGDCSKFSECIVFDTLSIDTVESTNFSVFPNPVHTYLNIKSSLVDAFDFTLYDVSGKQLLHIKNSITNSDVNMSKLPAGVYFLTVSTKENSQTFKVVKE